MFSLRIFMVLSLTFKSLIHFEFILCGVKRCSSFIFLHVYWRFSLFFEDFIYLLLERGKEGEEKNIRFLHTPSGGLARSPGMSPDWELNSWPFSLQAGTQSTEPHQPGISLFMSISPEGFLLNFQTLTFTHT